MLGQYRDLVLIFATAPVDIDVEPSVGLVVDQVIVRVFGGIADPKRFSWYFREAIKNIKCDSTKFDPVIFWIKVYELIAIAF